MLRHILRPGRQILTQTAHSALVAQRRHEKVKPTACSSHPHPFLHPNPPHATVGHQSEQVVQIGVAESDYSVGASVQAGPFWEEVQLAVGGAEGFGVVARVGVGGVHVPSLDLHL